MVSVANLPNRRPNITAAAQLSTIVKWEHNRPRNVKVPGHGNYRLVVLDWSKRKEGIVGAECLIQIPIGVLQCKGNGNNSVCYHSMAAVEKAFWDKGVEVVGWAANKELAVKSQNLKQFKGCARSRVVAKKYGKWTKQEVWFLWRRK